LQHAQQLDLQPERHVADLVEEQGAAMRRLEPAGARARRTGESAGFVPEQLGVDDRFRDRTAIDRHERPTALAGGMQMTREKFLAGAGLTDDQHARIATRQTLDITQHCERAPVLQRQRLGQCLRRGTKRVGRGLN